MPEPLDLDAIESVLNSPAGQTWCHERCSWHGYYRMHVSAMLTECRRLRAELTTVKVRAFLEAAAMVRGSEYPIGHMTSEERHIVRMAQEALADDLNGMAITEGNR